MIQTLYTIGKVLSKNKDHQKYFQPFENPFEKGKIIVAELKDYKYIKDSLQIGEEKKENNLSKYLYRKFNKGANIVPTFIVTDGKKTFDKLTSCIRQYHKNEFGYSTKINDKDFKELFTKEFDDLLIDLESFEYIKDNRYLFTLKINNKWLGEIEYFKDFFKDEFLKSYYTKKSSGLKISKHPNFVCSITNKKTEVFGFNDVLGFTVDDVSFCRGGFDPNMSYKMFPTSREATILVEGAKKLALRELKRTFFNLNYFILPHFIDRENEDLIEDVLDILMENSKDETYQVTGNSIIYNEDMLNAITKEDKLQNGIYYDILFYQQRQAQFLIKLQLADILPSRLSQIFKTKNRIENKYDKITRIEFEEKKTKEKKVNHFYINFNVVKDYFSKIVKKEIVYQPYFFKILETVFQGGYLNEQLILKAFMNKIRSDFKNMNEVGEFAYQNQAKYTFVLYQYFLTLGLFKDKKNMEKQKQVTVALTEDEFIKQHSTFFDNDYKKGIFLLGNLCSYLMWVQYDDKKSSPFKNQLNSLIIDKRTIKKIFPKAVNKLREYNKSRPNLESKIANFLVKEYNLSNIDTSYIFTLGMVMQKEFAMANKESIEKKKIEKCQD